MGPQIVSKAVTLVWTNLGAAIRATAVPFGLMAAMPVLFLQGPVPGEAPLQPGHVLVAVLSFLLFAWGSSAWHRYVLLEELPAPLPRPGGAAFIEYLWASIRTGAFTLAIIVLAILAISLLAGAFGSLSGAVGGGGVFPLVFGGVVLIAYVGLRVSLVLPAAALGRRMSLRQSWQATRPAWNAVLVAGLLVAGLQAVLAFVAEALAGVPLLGLVVVVVLNWVSVMIGLSILTALYGVLVEGRTVD